MFSVLCSRLLGIYRLLGGLYLLIYRLCSQSSNVQITLSRGHGVLPRESLN
jgi:hypothetical protein